MRCSPKSTDSYYKGFKILEPNINQPSIAARGAIEKIRGENDSFVFALAADQRGSYFFPYASPEFASLLGLSSDQLERNPDLFFQAIAKDEILWVKEAFKAFFEPNGIKKRAIRIKHRGQKQYWIEISVLSEPVVENGLVLQIGTAKDISDLKESEVSCSDSYALRKIAIENMIDGAVLTDLSTHRIIDANPAFEAMSGYTKEELSLLKVYDLDVCFSKEKLEKLICDGTKNGSVSRRLETQHRRKDGSIYDVEIAVSKAYWKNRPVSLAICRNISERKKVEKSLIKEKENLSAISMFLHELLTVRPGQNVIMKLVVEHAQRWTAGDAAAILLAGEGDLAITLATGVLEDSIGGRASISKSFSGHCLEQGKVILCNDLSHSSICSPILEAMGIQSIIAAPLYINTQRTGVILVTHKEIGKFDEDDVQMLEAMAGVVSTAMSRAAQIESTEILLTERTEMIDTLSRVNQRLENLATQDGLTGIKNHRAFQEELRIEFSRSERYNSQLSLIMVDVDRFKVFNDLFGHVFGDEVLRNVARVLQDNIRISDYLARYGGEEFVIVLPHTDSVTAADVAERCRIGIEETEWKLKNVTASFGVSSVSIMANTPEALIKAADSALYAAKSAGRNRVEIYQNSLLIDDFSLVDIGG